MAYKIAVATSDGIDIDLKFGEIKQISIYEADGNQYRLIEKREISDMTAQKCGNDIGEPVKTAEKINCGNGGCGNGGGCSGSLEASKRVELISDCRCLVCKKIGFQAQKQLERRAISYFDVTCSVSEALGKITDYYEKIEKRKGGIKNG